MDAAAMKYMTLNFSKLDKFEGVDFKRWQKKMHFLLSSMSVMYVLTTPIPDDGDDATVDQLRNRNKWDNDDYFCRGLILKGSHLGIEESPKKKMHFLLSSMSVVYVLTTLIPDDGDDATVDQLRNRNKWDNDDYFCRGLILKGSHLGIEESPKTKRKPNPNYLRVWGCRAVVRLPDPKLKTLGERGIECIVVRYAEHSKAIRFSSVPRSSLKIRNETEDIGGSVVLEKVDLTKEFLSIKVLYEGHGTPMDTSEKLMPNNGLAVSQLEYSKVIGCLMYAMTCIRPDIAFVVGKLSRYTSNPDTQHWQAIQWASKKKTCIAGSTMEYEFVTLAATGKEAEWLKKFLFEIPLWSKPIAPISIRCDSAATLAKAYSQIYNGKSRHLGVRHSMIRKLITNGVISIDFVRCQQNT
nr:hypothetical protein [Tanacetum cinerariifolium]